MTLPIFVDSSYRDKTNGLRVEQGDWYDITFYQEGVVRIARDFVRKGSQIAVSGRIRKHVWDSKVRKDDAGNILKDSRIEFTATEILLLGYPKDEAQNQATASQKEAATSTPAANEAGEATNETGSEMVGAGASADDSDASISDLKGGEDVKR